MNASVAIPVEEVTFHPFSHRDIQAARLFWWKESLYRAIGADRAHLYRQIIENGLVRKLSAQKMLIHTELTDLMVNGYQLIVRHRKIPFVSYPYEWSPAMLKDAALLILKLELELLSVGLTLCDPQLWNVMFEGSSPVYIDFGSIVQIDESPGWWENGFFEQTVLIPLRIACKGFGRIVRGLQRGYAEELQPAEVDRLLGLSVRTRVTRRFKNWARSARRVLPEIVWQRARKAYHFSNNVLARNPLTPAQKMRAVERLLTEVEHLNVPQRSTYWSPYYDDRFYSFTPCSDWTPKHRSVHQILSNLKPATVLDVGSNRGWYSQLAAVRGARVVACDVDEICVNQLYTDTKAGKLDILPLILDIHYPSPALGVAYRMLLSATERLRCDFVLALALVHHLVFRRHLLFPQIAEALAAFAKKWLLVEFVAHDDGWVHIDLNGYYEWYTLPNFVAALKNHFTRITTFESYPSTRTLVLCEK